ncbi:MAG TPA: multidrug efflux SMR transporter [Methanocella sp.]|nr:multidrug efflux SMR transporter [Methanocella sp.]
MNWVNWLYLLGAIIFEVLGTTSMKLSDGFSKLIPSAAILGFYLLSLGLLTLALKKIDVSIAYAIWSAIGTAMITCIGIFYFKEPATTLKLASISLIIAGVVGLNLAGGAH